MSKCDMCGCLENRIEELEKDVWEYKEGAKSEACEVNERGGVIVILQEALNTILNKEDIIHKAEMRHIAKTALNSAFPKEIKNV